PFFFFQAEDGIRDATVTGVQTCALPIYRLSRQLPALHGARAHQLSAPARRRPARPVRGGREGSAGLRVRGALDDARVPQARAYRSEERRVGKECSSRWWADD